MHLCYFSSCSFELVFVRKFLGGFLLVSHARRVFIKQLGRDRDKFTLELLHKQTGSQSPLNSANHTNPSDEPNLTGIG